MTDEHITDTREMRKRLMEMALGRPFDDRDPHPSICCGIIRNVRDAACYAGLSGEDLYTMMAWHLLHHAARMEKVALRQAMLEPATQTIDPPHNYGETMRCVDCGYRKFPDGTWRAP